MRATIVPSFVFLAFVVEPVSAAKAQPAQASAKLSYAASPAGCPEESSFRDLVTARLGYDPFDGGESVRVTVEITKQNGTLQGRAEIARGGATPGTRELTGELGRCEPLAAALATTVAIALDPGRALAPPASPEPPAPQPAPTPPPPAPASTLVVVRERDAPPPPPPPEPLRLSLLVTAGGAGSVAVGPAPTFGPELGIMMRVKELSVEASGRVETILGDVHSASGDRLEATVFSGSVVPCAHLGALSGCAFGRLGSFQGRAPDVATPHLLSSFYGAVGLRGAYTLSLGSALGLRGAIDAGLPLVRTSLQIDGSAVWTAPPVFVGASLALVLKLR